MELVFVRHGQPAWAVGGLSQADPGLTELGRRQAELVAERLSAGKRPVAEVITSHAGRAQETAAPLAARLGLEPEVVPDLTEMRLPDWTGHLEEEVQRIFAQARSRSPEEWWDGLPGGESFHAFHDRVTAAIAKLLAARDVTPDEDRHPQLWQTRGDAGRIAIFGHAGTNSVAMGLLLGVEPTPWEWERFILGHASIARLRTVPLAGAYVFSLRSFNDQEHLPPDSRSR